MAATAQLLASARRHGLRALGAVLMISLASVAQTAQTDAATTIQGTYFDVQTKTCTKALICDLRFAAIPAGKTLLIARATCALTLPSSAKIEQIQIRRMTAGKRTGFQYLAPINLFSDAMNKRSYVVNVPSLLALMEDDQPAIYIRLEAKAAKIVATCTVHGTIN